MAVTVLLDTNFVLIPGQFGIDIFAEISRICDFPHKVAVLPQTMGELAAIIGSKKASAKDRDAAKLGLQLLKVRRVEAVSPERKVFKSTDKAILQFAASGGKSVVVATQDRALKSALKSAGVRVIVMRQMRHLVLE